LRSPPTGRYIGRRFAAVALLAALALVCAGEPESPEARVLALLERAEVAAEERDVKALREMISERYADEQGRDKAALKALLAFHFLRNQSVHLLTRAGEIALPTPERAEVVVFVAMAGRPIPGPEALVGLRADLYRFDLVFEEVEGEEWRLVRAGWRRAMPDDFL
jgi:hypothetical protein